MIPSNVDVLITVHRVESRMEGLEARQVELLHELAAVKHHLVTLINSLAEDTEVSYSLDGVASRERDETQPL